LLGVVAFGVSAEAWAQRADWDPDTHRSGAGVELYPWASDLGFHTAFIGFANIEAVDTFFIDPSLPIAGAIASEPGEEARAGLGNPSVAFRYAPKHGMVRWWIGGGLAAPLNAVDEDDWNLAVFRASMAMGFYNHYLWAEDAFPTWFTWGVDIRPIDILSIQFSGEPIVYVDVDDGGVFGDNDDVELGLQNRFGVELRDPQTGVGGGAHFKFVYFPTVDGDNFQAALEPFFAYTGDVFFVRFGLLFALDEPLGPPFDDGKVFSQHATLGGSWD
jgi:hypothetical protein